MNIREWQTRLEETFLNDGVLAGHLREVLDREREYSSYVTQTFFGYYVLTDSFLSFYIETLHIAESQRRKSKAASAVQWYAPLLLDVAVTFRTFRAAENLLLYGYPLSGYALLRDLKDRAVFLAAIANKITIYRDIHGFQVIEGKEEALSEEDMRKVYQSCLKEEKRVMKIMTEPKSQADKENQNELRRWHEMFNKEVHGARLTFTAEGKPWIQGKAHLSILPAPHRESIAMYLNRSSEIGWMLLRTFPFLQLEPQAFGSDWAQKWQILDESFRSMVEGLERTGRKIASAIIHFIDRTYAKRQKAWWSLELGSLKRAISLS